MAVVKAKFTKSRKGAKATVRYITHRPNKDGRKAARSIFGVDGEVNKEQAYQLIDEAAKGSTFFRIIISPDPEKEDTQKDLYLWQITETTMLNLEERLKKYIPFIAVEHNDHAAHRHVHILACIKGRLNTRDFDALRRSATQAALLQLKSETLPGRLAFGQ